MSKAVTLYIFGVRMWVKALIRLFTGFIPLMDTCSNETTILQNGLGFLRMHAPIPV